MAPRAELVGDLLVLSHAEGEAVGVGVALALGGLGLEVAHATPGLPRGAHQVRLGLLVRVAPVHAAAVVLGDGDAEVGVDEGGEAAPVAAGVAAEELVQLERPRPRGSAPGRS